MRCPKCGNEVGQDEVFCGQCGTPITLPAGATDMVNIPSPLNELPGSYNASTLNNPNYPNMPPMMSPGQGSYSSQMPPSNAYNNANIPVPPGGPLAPIQQQSQQLRQPMGPQQQSGFYKDATEAIVSIPQNNSPVYPPGYQQQPGFTGNAGQSQSGYVGGSQYGTQGPYPTPSFPATTYPASATPPGQGYGHSTPLRPTPPPKKQASALLVFAIVCLIVAVITVGAFGLIYLLRNHSSPTATIPTVMPTTAVTPTTVPGPTPSPTALATATPVPSPAVSPTPLPDPNFAWCTICTPNGFNVEYPLGWNQTNPTTGSTTDVRFLNTSPGDQYADFKALGATTSSAGDLVTADLQANYASLPGYTAPTGGALNYTIGGENWTYETATYQLNGQPEQIVVYATVHQQKAYIIELQAATSQFATVNTQYFSVMLNKFLFQ